jgi:hypothetical protein
MRNVQRNNQDKRVSGTGAKVKASRNERASSQKPVETKEGAIRQSQDRSSSFLTQAVLSEDQFRARVAQKAYELYQKRQSLTEKDDWLEAERLVRLELLSEEHGAGSV